MSMLSKGIKLYYSTTGGSSASWTELTGLQEVPNLGGTVDKVEITTLANDAHTYIAGLKEYGDMDFKFLYDNSAATSNYRVLKGIEREDVYWKVEFPDAATSSGTGTLFNFSGQSTVSIDGMATNAAATFTLSIAVTSDITVTNPA